DGARVLHSGCVRPRDDRYSRRARVLSTNLSLRRSAQATGLESVGRPLSRIPPLASVDQRQSPRWRIVPYASSDPWSWPWWISGRCEWAWARGPVGWGWTWGSGPSQPWGAG